MGEFGSANLGGADIFSLTTVEASIHGFAGVDGGRSSSARYPSFAPPTRTQVARIRCQTSKPTADGGNAPPALGPAALPASKYILQLVPW